MAEYLTREELGAKGYLARMVQIETEVARRYTLAPEVLEEEDRRRLSEATSLRYPPVFSIVVFMDRYSDLVRGLILGKFHVVDLHDQEECFQEVFTRLMETRHLLSYRPMIFKEMSAVEPIRKENEREQAFAKRLARWQEKVAPYAGKVKVSFPSFQTHIFTVTQTCCVNKGVRENRDPSTHAISLDMSYDEDDRSTLVERLFDPRSKNHEDLVIYGELLDEFEKFLVDKYCNRVQSDGSVVDC